MKKYKILLFVIALIGIIMTINGQMYQLNVIDGYGSGSYMKGDTVEIWAKATKGDSVFVSWSIDDDPDIELINEWHSQLVVSPDNLESLVNVTATFDVLPNSTVIGVDSFYLFGENEFEEQVRTFKNIYYGIPSNPTGIVFLFHGTGGSGASFLIDLKVIN
ncbi:MAG: hypothetical protein V3V14_03915 [Saprospiraceae bacterium]